MVESTREISGKVKQGTHYYITSLVILKHLLGPGTQPLGNREQPALGHGHSLSRR